VLWMVAIFYTRFVGLRVLVFLMSWHAIVCMSQHFGSTAGIAFNGYATGPTTKDHEHSRRGSKKLSLNISFAKY